MNTAQKIPLKKESTPPAYHTERNFTVQWRMALPFFINNRGILIHRVRSVRSFLRDGELNHSSIKYLCGNNGSLGDGSLISEPPADRLVCAACEAFAFAHGLPSADQLVGRHCHVGKIRAEQTCCCEQRESN